MRSWINNNPCPSIWLCLDCRSCMSACSQGVKGARIIRQIQQIAYEEGFVAKDFPIRWEQLKSEVYVQYIHEVDKLLEKARTVKQLTKNQNIQDIHDSICGYFLL
ncbi:MAG: hypothetical protein PVJ50_01335 [Desulfobacterales bacterium]